MLRDLYIVLLIACSYLSCNTLSNSGFLVYESLGQDCKDSLILYEAMHIFPEENDSMWVFNHQPLSSKGCYILDDNNELKNRDSMYPIFLTEYGFFKFGWIGDSIILYSVHSQKLHKNVFSGGNIGDTTWKTISPINKTYGFLGDKFTVRRADTIFDIQNKKIECVSIEIFDKGFFNKENDFVVYRNGAIDSKNKDLNYFSFGKIYLSKENLYLIYCDRFYDEAFEFKLKGWGKSKSQYEKRR